MLGWLILPQRMESTTNIAATYGQQADELESAVQSIPAEQVARRPSESRWSVLEIVCHLADAELLASARIRRTITQDRPNFWGYQQEQWAAELAYQQQRIETVTRRFAMLRRENAELLAALSQNFDGEIWARAGVHDQYGKLTLRQLIEDYLAHTAKHLDQIRKTRAEFAAPDSV